MVYNEELADRIRKLLVHRKGITEKKMFGGLSFLLYGKMCCGVLKDILVVRVNPKEFEILIKKPYVRPMDFTGRPMKGFLYVSRNGYKAEKQLSVWIDHSVDFVLSNFLPKSKNKIQK